MSDADDQMGGSGGDTGLRPEDVVPGQDNAAPAEPAGDQDDVQDKETEESEQSFPASDPPGNY